MVVILNVDGDSVVMRFPASIKIKGKDTDSLKVLLYQGDYCGYIYTHSYQNDTYDNVRCSTEFAFRIPHYLCEDLKWIEDNMLGKCFYDRKEFGQSHSRISEDYNKLYFDKLDYNGEELVIEITERTAKGDINHTIALDKFNGNAYGGWDKLNMKRLQNDFISEDSMIAEAKKKSDYDFFRSINGEYLNKSVHINDISYRYASHGIFNMMTSEDIDCVKDGDYIYVGYDVFCDKRRKLYPEYDTYVVFQTEDSTIQFAVPFTKGEFLKNVMLSSEYKRMVEEQALLKEQKEQALEAKRKASERAENARLVRKYGATNAKLIKAGDIRLGFTRAMVEEAWGSPSDITTVTNALGSIECWIYGIGHYVYFKGGKVVQIIN